MTLKNNFQLKFQCTQKCENETIELYGRINDALAEKETVIQEKETLIQEVKNTEVEIMELKAEIMELKAEKMELEAEIEDLKEKLRISETLNEAPFIDEPQQPPKSNQKSTKSRRSIHFAIKKKARKSMDVTRWEKMPVFCSFINPHCLGKKQLLPIELYIESTRKGLNMIH